MSVEVADGKLDITFTPKSNSPAIKAIEIIPQSPDAKESDTIRIKEIAGESGLNVVDLTDVYAGQDFSALRLNQWDSHPNPTGHPLIADALFNHLLELDREQVIDLSGSRNEDAP